MQFANSSLSCYSTFTSDSCHAINHSVAKTFVDEETLVMLVGYSAAARQRPARQSGQSFKRRLNEYFTITKKAPNKSLVGAFSVIVKSLHNLREPSFEALMERGERESGERGDDINISDQSRGIQHHPQIPYAAADQTAVSVQHFQHVDTSICNNIFKTENLVFRSSEQKNIPTGVVTFWAVVRHLRYVW